MKKGFKRTLFVTTLTTVSPFCAIVAAATSSTVSSSFTYNGMGYTAYGNNSSSLTKNFEKIQLSTSVAAHYGATAKQEKVYVNWQKANTVTGNKFGTIQEEFKDNATRVDAVDDAPLGYKLTVFSYHEVKSNGKRVLSKNTESYIS